jgi:hypothetical protein
MKKPEIPVRPEDLTSTQNFINHIYDVLDSISTLGKLDPNTSHALKVALAQLESLRIKSIRLTVRSTNLDKQRGIRLPKGSPPGFSISIEADKSSASLPKFQIDGVGPFEQDSTLKSGFSTRFHVVGRDENDNRPAFDLYLEITTQGEIRIVGSRSLAPDQYTQLNSGNLYTLSSSEYGVKKMHEELRTLLTYFQSQLPPQTATMRSYEPPNRNPEYRGQPSSRSR